MVAGVDLFLEQVTKAGRAGRRRINPRIFTDGIALVLFFLGTDGQADSAILAINTDEARFNGFTFGQHTTGILYPVPGNVRGTDVTAEAIDQLDLCAQSIHTTTD